jgi:uncharacterized membrane protein
MGKILLRGLVGIAPIAITAALINWLFNEFEYIFGTPIKAVVGQQYYFPGLGIIIALIIFFFLGLIFNSWIIQRVYNLFERLVKRIPLLKTIYTAITDFMSFFRSDKHKGDKVVLVKFGKTKIMGLLTRTDFTDFSEEIDADFVAVFFPFSYQIGGMTVLVPKKNIEPLDVSLEKGLRFCVTAGSPGADKPMYDAKKKK